MAENWFAIYNEDKSLDKEEIKQRMISCENRVKDLKIYLESIKAEILASKLSITNSEKQDLQNMWQSKFEKIIEAIVGF